MLLNYKEQGNGPAIVLIHGLFGSLDNLGSLARHLETSFHVISVDLRNHGRSFHSADVTYDLMAQDIKALMVELEVTSYSVVGHSMGGKVAMTLAASTDSNVERIAILDMAPVDYHIRRHENVFAGLKAVDQAQPIDRSEAISLLREHIVEPGVIQFLNKSLYRGKTHYLLRFNIDALYEQYDNIIGWHELPPNNCPTLFIKGQNSEYIIADYQPQILKQFPSAKAHMVANTGHWLHAEKPDTINRIVSRFLQR